MATESKFNVNTIQSVNPATGEVLRELECAGEREVHAAVARSRAAQSAWSALGVSHRSDVLRRFQQALQKRKTDIARLITREAGKPVGEALVTEVVVALDAARFCIENAPAVLRPERLRYKNPILKAKSGRIQPEPWGVVGIISPWNYPFSIPASEAIAALILGNAVVIKPSEFTPLCALELAELFSHAGLPKGVLEVVVGEGPTGAALLAAEIDKIIFTGSVATGKRVAQAAAARLLPAVLELGGKDPMIVLEDADVDVASSGAVWGAFVNAGQTCLSVERCYVVHPHYERFVALCAEKVAKLRVGNGLDPGTDLGPLIHERQLQIVEEQVNDAVARGARLVVGGKRLPELGPNFYAPTVLADMKHSMRIMREETFGPVLPVMPVADEAEAVRFANDSEFGLAASVWTRDAARGERIATQLQVGTVMINDAVTCFGISEAPHGGVKASGLGRTHGIAGLQEMVRPKFVDVDALARVRRPWWYAYGPGFEAQMSGFVDWLFAKEVSKRIKGALKSSSAILRKKI
jgi:succinate-semialdehyde dehydrogenase/glutarate-semialdehyde dehydrogenase